MDSLNFSEIWESFWDMTVVAVQGFDGGDVWNSSSSRCNLGIWQLCCYERSHLSAAKRKTAMQSRPCNMTGQAPLSQNTISKANKKEEEKEGNNNTTTTTTRSQKKLQQQHLQHSTFAKIIGFTFAYGQHHSHGEFGGLFIGAASIPHGLIRQ